jgi:hypothetical protein
LRLIYSSIAATYTVYKIAKPSIRLLRHCNHSADVKLVRVVNSTWNLSVRRLSEMVYRRCKRKEVRFARDDGRNFACEAAIYLSGV